MFSAVARSAAVCVAIALLRTFASAAPAHTPAPADEVRALWVVRTTLTSPAAIATLVSSARASGFNTLLVQVRGRGDAYYQGGLEPRPAALAAQPQFDPLATVIARAHDAGLQVHAWINVNLVAGLELPSAREHLVYRHPDWLMVPRALTEDLRTVDPRSPEYLGRLNRYVRSRPDVEGLYVSPVNDMAVEYTTRVVRDIATRYDVDGVHLDYIRYPEEDFDYGRETLAAFRQSILSSLNATDRQRFDARIPTEPLIYTRAFAERWRAFRSSRLTALLSRLRETVKGARPSAVLTAAVVPDPVDANHQRLQDWPAWIARDLLDVICPMAYATDPAVFINQLTAARDAAGSRPVWAGIGAYRLSPEQIVDNVQAARRLGSAGVILFSYDSLTDPSRGPDYLTRLGRAAFTQ